MQDIIENMISPKTKEKFTKLGKDRVPKAPMKITENSVKSRHTHIARTANQHKARLQCTSPDTTPARREQEPSPTGETYEFQAVFLDVRRFKSFESHPSKKRGLGILPSCYFALCPANLRCKGKVLPVLWVTALDSVKPVVVQALPGEGGICTFHLAKPRLLHFSQHLTFYPLTHWQPACKNNCHCEPFQ